MAWLAFDTLIQWWSFGLVALVLYFCLTKFTKQLDDMQDIMMWLRDSMMSCKEALDSQRHLTDKLLEKLFKGN